MRRFQAPRHVSRARDGALIALVAAVAGLAGYAYRSHSIAPKASESAAASGLHSLLTTPLPDLEQRPQSIGQWRGKVTVVNFWATWCAPCREEIPIFIRLQEQFGARGLQFVGVAIDDPDKVRPYAAELGMNFPVLIGAAGAIELTRSLGNKVGALPYTVVIDRAGRIAAVELGLAKESKLKALLASLL